MKFPKSKKPISETKKLDTRLWKLFSIFIRKRDCSGGNGICITCGSPITFCNCDAGHFMSRRFKTTRFVETNVNGQCKKCNRFENGNQFDHGLAIDKKFGAGTAERLCALAHTTSKLTKEWYEDMIKIYSEKIKKMC